MSCSFAAFAALCSARAARVGDEMIVDDGKGLGVGDKKLGGRKAKWGHAAKFGFAGFEVELN